MKPEDITVVSENEKEDMGDLSELFNVRFEAFANSNLTNDGGIRVYFCMETNYQQMEKWVLARYLADFPDASFRQVFISGEYRSTFNMDVVRLCPQLYGL